MRWYEEILWNWTCHSWH